MSIEQTQTIDFIGIEKKSGNVILTISDHLDWSDSGHHLMILQEKINSYLRFYESGEIYQVYPEARGREIAIDIVGKYPPDEQGRLFIQRAEVILNKIGLLLRLSTLR